MRQGGWCRSRSRIRRLCSTPRTTFSQDATDHLGKGLCTWQNRTATPVIDSADVVLYVVRGRFRWDRWIPQGEVGFVIPSVGECDAIGCLARATSTNAVPEESLAVRARESRRNDGGLTRGTGFT